MAMSVQTTFGDAPAIGYAGQLDAATIRNGHIITLKNTEASLSIPFGYAVCFDLTSPVTDKDAILPAAETDIVAGLVVKRDTYARSWTDSDGVVHGQLDGTGLVPGTLMSVLRRGVMLCIAEDAVAVGDRLWVRCTTGGAGEIIGGVLNADEGTETIDCTKQGVWLSSAAAGGLAWLSVDFNAKP